jgi:hypothetical protein
LLAVRVRLEHMNRRARRVTIAAAGLGVLVMAFVIVRHWDMVGEQTRAWRFVVTREMTRILPSSISRSGEAVEVHAGYIEVRDILRFIADYTGEQILVEVEDEPNLAKEIEVMKGVKGLTAEGSVKILRAEGFDIVHLKFPRRAYVLFPDVADRRRAMTTWERTNKYLGERFR